MPGINSSDTPSLANGVPARHIGPETGSSGNATVTNTAGTSESANQTADSRPAGASGLDTDIDTGAGLKEDRSFSATRYGVTPGADLDDETAAQRIADGEDRIRHDDDKDRADR